MKTVCSLSPRFRAASTLTAGASALLAILGTPCHAQFSGQFPAPTPPPAAPAPSPILPDGTDQLFALMGTNDLLALSTPEGYERIRQLVRAIDGQTDIIRTKVVTVDTDRSNLEKLGYDIVGWPKPVTDTTKTASTGDSTLPDGVERIYALQGGGLFIEPTPTSVGMSRVTVNLGQSPLHGAEVAAFTSALASGKLTPTETLRITTRENTVVDTLLHNPGARSDGGGTPFSLIPRESRNNQLTLEIIGPVSTQIGMQSGQTAVLALPGLTTDAVRLLFLTPTVLPSNSRY